MFAADLSQNRMQDKLQLLAGQAVWLIAEHQLVCMQWACLAVPLDDVVGSGTQVKDRLALGIKQHSLGWHEACHHNEEAAVRRPLSIMNWPILYPYIVRFRLARNTVL